MKVTGTDGKAIADAVRKATSADPVVQLESREYVMSAHLALSKPGVMLLGAPNGGTVLRAAPGSTKDSVQWGLLVNAPGVVIHDLAYLDAPHLGCQLGDKADGTLIDSVRIDGSGRLGFHVLRAHNTVLAHCHSTNNGSNGIDMHGADGCVVKDSVFSYNGSPRSADHLVEGCGILVFCGKNVDIVRNTVVNNSRGQLGKRDGIRLSDRASADQIGNEDFPTSDVRVIDNVIVDTDHNTGYGIAVGFGKTTDLDRIVVTGNRGAGAIKPGVFTGGLKKGATATIENNALL